MQACKILRGSPWSRAAIAKFLGDTVIPVRLAALDREHRPVVMSLWFVYRDDCLWCATQRTARLIALLSDSPVVGFEVAGDAPPYHGVRGQGTVVLSPQDGPRVLEELIERYLDRRDSGLARWLLARRDREVAIQIRPDWMTAWDYRERMRDAVGA